jgi:Helix-turn-helix domain
MRQTDEYMRVIQLAREGFNASEIARVANLSRSTIRDWVKGKGGHEITVKLPRCPRCGAVQHTSTDVPSYAYVLGMYLGDGDIGRVMRTWRLRISLDVKWPGVIRECREALEHLFPHNRVAVSGAGSEEGCAIVRVYSNHLPCLFPQHGTGPKHTRRLVLEPWQEASVQKHPEWFLRGLVHSDGCRYPNRVRSNGRDYVYPSYAFTNCSRDLQELFIASCEHLRIDCRRQNRFNVVVTRRRSVARMDELVGPKS